MARLVFEGVNGRPIGVDLKNVQAVLQQDGEIHLVTSSDTWRVRADFDQVVKDWQDG